MITECCGREIKQKKRYIEHVRAKGGLCFKCVPCDKVFPQKQNLSRHLKTCPCKKDQVVERLNKLEKSHAKLQGKFRTLLQFCQQ